MATLPDITNNKIISKILSNKIILAALGFMIVISIFAVIGSGNKKPGSLYSLSSTYKSSNQLVELFDKYQPNIAKSDAATQQLITQTRILMSGNSQEIIAYGNESYDKKTFQSNFKRVTKPDKKDDKQISDAIKINAFEINITNVIKNRLSEQKEYVISLAPESGSELEKLKARLIDNIASLEINPLLN
jgi:hypothetical protein